MPCKQSCCCCCWMMVHPLLTLLLQPRGAPRPSGLSLSLCCCCPSINSSCCPCVDRSTPCSPAWLLGRLRLGTWAGGWPAGSLGRHCTNLDKGATRQGQARPGKAQVSDTGGLTIQCTRCCLPYALSPMPLSSHCRHRHPPGVVIQALRHCIDQTPRLLHRLSGTNSSYAVPHKAPTV